MGCNIFDSKFRQNTKALVNKKVIKGVYHYFRPDEDAEEQAKNYIKNVVLKPGDLPPILDIEQVPSYISMKSLNKGLRKWMTMVSTHYGVKPILYSGDKYFKSYLVNEFSDHVLWIANYSLWNKKFKSHWQIWQFSERGYVKGISTNVDLNVFNGSLEEFKRLTIKKEVH